MRKSKASNAAQLEKEIVTLEASIRDQKKKLAQLRRKATPVKFQDAVFKDSLGQKVALSQLFGSKSELILVHNMGVKCSFCTLWADGFNGVLKHIENQAAFAVESPDEPALQRKFALDRGWSFKMISSKGTSFREETGYASEMNEPWPGISVFKRMRDGRIYRVSDSQLGPGDNYCILWDLFDLLPQGGSQEEIDYFYSKVR